MYRAQVVIVGVLYFLIDLGRCVLGISERVRAPTAPFPESLASGKSPVSPRRPVPSCLAKLGTNVRLTVPIQRTIHDETRRLMNRDQ